MEVTINAKATSLSIKNKQKSLELGATYTEKLLANDYNTLKNKPQIEGIELKDNKTFEDLGATSLSNIEIENLINMQI